MTKDELKAHCERQTQQFERVEKIMPVTPYDWKRYEEHKLVLELLEQEPCDDCISRQAVMQALYDCGCESKIQNAIAELPPATPKRPKGEWELTDDKQSYCCSCCKNHWISAIEHLHIWKYCPNCGADMREVSE